MSTPGSLSRRERQIMDILYQRGKASASEVREAMEAAPGYSAVRAMLRVLEEKGHVKHQAEGLKYVYVPTVARDKAKRSAVKHVMETFFAKRDGLPLPSLTPPPVAVPAPAPARPIARAQSPAGRVALSLEP